MWGQPPSAVRSSADRLVFCSGRGLTQPDSPFLSRHCYPLIPMLEFCDIAVPVPLDMSPRMPRQSSAAACWFHFASSA
jgi:hypothetical protein